MKRPPNRRLLAAALLLAVAAGVGATRPAAETGERDARPSPADTVLRAAGG